MTQDSFFDVVIIDFEKAYDSINKKFLFMVLKKIGFLSKFIKIIEVENRNASSCIFGNEKTQTNNLE